MFEEMTVVESGPTQLLMHHDEALILAYLEQQAPDDEAA
jgi:hypothetical protein